MGRILQLGGPSGLEAQTVQKIELSLWSPTHSLDICLVSSSVIHNCKASGTFKVPKQQCHKVHANVTLMQHAAKQTRAEYLMK
jgi:hypothetical protein